jgi:hypothetical protein
MISNGLKKFYPIFLLFFASCGSKNRLDVDLSSVSQEVNFVDWVPVLDAKDPENTLKQLKSTSTELSKYYLGTMIGADPAIDSQCLKMLDLFMFYPSTVEGIKEIKSVFKDFKTFEEEITLGFKHVKFHYPSTKSITVYMYHSGFNFGVFPVNNELGIGLDMYLGTENKITRALPGEKFPQYMKNNMRPENLVVDVLRGYTIINLVPENTGKDLLSNLVYEGKILFAMDAFLPDKEDYSKIRYTKEQLEWCINYEKQIWKEIIDNTWLYSTEAKMINQFIIEAPFTGTLPQESPPRAGAWLGWQMVKAYANEHEELSVKQILEEVDPRKILRSYKPPK